jgi:putative inorganic carbon (hco3(-)) transporter
MLAGLSLVFYLAPWPPLYLPAGLLLAALTLFRLDLALLLVPFYLPFFPAPKHVGHWQFAPSELLIVLDVLAAIALVASRRVTVPWNAAIRSRFAAPAALLVVAGIASTAAAADRHVALEWLRWTIAEPVLYFVLLLAFLRQGRYWVYLALSAVLGGTVVGAIGIGQSLVATDGPTVPLLGVHLQQAKGAYGSPDNLGLLYDRIVPLWLPLALSAAPLRRIAYGILGVILAAALFLAYSRGAWVAVAIAAVAVLIWSRHWGRWLAVATVVLVALVGAAAGPKIAQTLTSGHAGTASKRLVIWTAAARMVRDHPLLGIGPDNFQHYYAPTRQQDRWQSECPPGVGYVGTNAHGEPCLSHPHNEFLDFWLSTGVAGLIAFLWLELVFWKEVAGWLARRDPLVLGAAAAMLASLIHGLVDNSYFLPDLAVLFWILCALLSWRRAEQVVV